MWVCVWVCVRVCECQGVKLCVVLYEAPKRCPCQGAGDCMTTQHERDEIHFLYVSACRSH
jgi:hypothetical protein